MITADGVVRGLGLSAMIAVGSLTGCSFSASVGGTSIDQAGIEQQISEGLEADVGVAPEAVDCEGISDVEVEEGGIFTCEGTAPNGDKFDINVTFTDDEGGFTAVVPG